jgi:predicted kinase
MATLYIIRGISGSGKTTLAVNMAAKLKCHYWEADMFFCDEDGRYKFDATQLPKAHEWCFDWSVKSLVNGHDVIVSNTFTRLWEMRNYVDFALERGHKVRIITCTGRYQNVHGLTEEMVAKQEARFQSNAQIAQELKHDWNRYGKIVYVNH